MGWPVVCRMALFLVSTQGHQSEDNSKNEEEDSGRDFHVRLSLLFACELRLRLYELLVWRAGKLPKG